MKKILFATIVAIFAFGLASCDKNESTSKADKADLIGTWQMTHLEGWYKVDGKIEEEWDDPIGYIDRYTFNENGTGRYVTNETGHSDESEFTWLLSENTNTLYITYAGQILTNTVEELTSSRMVLSRLVKQGREEEYTLVTLTKMQN